MKKKLTFLFLTIENDLLGKDVFLVPYYLGKVYNLDVKIVYLETETNQEMPSEYRGVKLERIKPGKIHKETAFIKYLWKNANKMDSMMLFHLRYFSAILGVIYKKLNPKGFLYVKADGLGFLRSEVINSTSFLHKVVSPLYKFFLQNINLLSVETDKAYSFIKKNKIYGVDIASKTKMMINGFDEDLLELYQIENKNFEEKGNLIITVGRLGVIEKNSEMLLEAATNTDFKNWKLQMIGPLLPEFKSKTEIFFNENPDLKDKVIFTGGIYDKKELWSLYSKAKVFVLTSRFEGFAIVYAEALRFNNYIVTTDVGGAIESLKLGNGEIVEQENPNHLASILQEIIDGKEIFTQSKVNEISWENLVKTLGFLN